jgi:membrane-bound serine protease (ClpP class)
MVFLISLALAFFVLPQPLGIAVVILGASFEIGEVFFWKRFLRRYRVSTGAEALVGATAEVIERCDPQGRVRLRGELWQARCEQPAAVGETVFVHAVDGLTLEVGPKPG